MPENLSPIEIGIYSVGAVAVLRFLVGMGQILIQHRQNSKIDVSQMSQKQLSRIGGYSHKKGVADYGDKVWSENEDEYVRKQKKTIYLDHHKPNDKIGDDPPLYPPSPF